MKIKNKLSLTLTAILCVTLASCSSSKSGKKKSSYSGYSEMVVANKQVLNGSESTFKEVIESLSSLNNYNDSYVSSEIKSNFDNTPQNEVKSIAEAYIEGFAKSCEGELHNIVLRDYELNTKKNPDLKIYSSSFSSLSNLLAHHIEQDQAITTYNKDIIENRLAHLLKTNGDWPGLWRELTINKGNTVEETYFCFEQGQLVDFAGITFGSYQSKFLLQVKSMEKYEITQALKSLLNKLPNDKAEQPLFGKIEVNGDVFGSPLRYFRELIEQGDKTKALTLLNEYVINVKPYQFQFKWQYEMYQSALLNNMIDSNDIDTNQKFFNASLEPLNSHVNLMNLGAWDTPITLLNAKPKIVAGRHLTDSDISSLEDRILRSTFGRSNSVQKAYDFHSGLCLSSNAIANIIIYCAPLADTTSPEITPLLSAAKNKMVRFISSADDKTRLALALYYANYDKARELLRKYPEWLEPGELNNYIITSHIENYDFEEVLEDTVEGVSGSSKVYRDPRNISLVHLAILAEEYKLIDEMAKLQLPLTPTGYKASFIADLELGSSPSSFSSQLRSTKVVNSLIRSLLAANYQITSLDISAMSRYIENTPKKYKYSHVLEAIEESKLLFKEVQTKFATQVAKYKNVNIDSINENAIHNRELTLEQSKTLEVKALKGDKVAQYLLGLSLKQNSDFFTANDWFEKSAKQGSVKAATELVSSILMNRGIITPQDAEYEEKKIFYRAKKVTTYMPVGPERDALVNVINAKELCVRGHEDRYSSTRYHGGPARYLGVYVRCDSLASAIYTLQKQGYKVTSKNDGFYILKLKDKSKKHYTLSPDTIMFSSTTIKNTQQLATLQGQLNQRVVRFTAYFSNDKDARMYRKQLENFKWNYGNSYETSTNINRIFEHNLVWSLNSDKINGPDDNSHTSVHLSRDEEEGSTEVAFSTVINLGKAFQRLN